MALGVVTLALLGFFAAGWGGAAGTRASSPTEEANGETDREGWADVSGRGTWDVVTREGARHEDVAHHRVDPDDRHDRHARHAAQVQLQETSGCPAVPWGCGMNHRIKRGRFPVSKLQVSDLGLIGLSSLQAVSPPSWAGSPSSWAAVWLNV